MYCLWLNGKKVYTIQQLRESFDIEAVELYCLGGGLARWLKDCGEQAAAERVEHIDLSQSISRQLAEIFDVDLPEREEQEYRLAVTSKAPAPAVGGSSSFTLDTSFFTGSFESSFNITSFTFSNIYTSFFTTSFLTTSFSGGYEYEYEYESGSFAANSFSLYLSSFFAETPAGSFLLGSFTSEYGSFTPESASFYPALSSFSPESVQAIPEQETAPLTPQQKFRLNLSSCPLNRYGYGLHLV